MVNHHVLLAVVFRKYGDDIVPFAVFFGFVVLFIVLCFGFGFGFGFRVRGGIYSPQFVISSSAIFEVR